MTNINISRRLFGICLWILLLGNLSNSVSLKHYWLNTPIIRIICKWKSFVKKITPPKLLNKYSSKKLHIPTHKTAPKPKKLDSKWHDVILFWKIRKLLFTHFILKFACELYERSMLFYVWPILQRHEGQTFFYLRYILTKWVTYIVWFHQILP